MRMRIGRPSAAMVIACCAFAASVGGTAFAEKANKQITSKNIADGTIKNRDVKDDTLKGNKIAEGSLAQVPSAASADSATNATTANSATTAGSADTAGDSDTVGGQSPDDLETRWVLVGADGTIVAQTGGFTLVNCYAANANCYIDAGEDVTDNAIDAEIATSNNPDAGTDGQLTGDTSASPCFFDFVNCGPAGTDTGNGGNNGVFVVTPRNSDGTDPGAGDRYPFYATISDSEAVAAR